MAMGSVINISVPWTTNLVNNAANYAQQCYSTNTSGMFDCTSFVKPNLPTILDQSAACPFQNGLCRANDSNLVLDTGYIDTNKHLGINWPPGQNILIRSVMQCAPLVTEGHKWNASETRETFTRYDYGPYHHKRLAYTYEVESLDYQYNKENVDILSHLGCRMRLMLVWRLSLPNICPPRYICGQPNRYPTSLDVYTAMY
jgi:hypothetical protein